jgi:hypothetical protein
LNDVRDRLLLDAFCLIDIFERVKFFRAFMLDYSDLNEEVSHRFV